MNVIDNYITSNGHYLEGLSFNKSDSEIEIYFSKLNFSVKLNKRALSNLLKKKLIDSVPQFKYYNHFGFSYDNYTEFFISIDSIILRELYEYNTNFDLKFKIAEYKIEIDGVSSLCKILLEPYYSKQIEYIEDRGLNEYTIKIYDAPISQHKNLLIKTLYYLNSHYLQKNKDGYVKINNVLSDDYEEVFDDSNFDKEVNIERKRTRTRKDFLSIEPIILFNHASTQDKENRFLAFYRILEFFFNRALEYELKKSRLDSNVSEKKIIQTIQKKDEKHLLYTLLNNTLTSAEKKRIVSFLLSKSLIEKDKFECFCNKLYEYRNSLVHAKEYQIDLINLPDLFDENKDWNY